MPRTGRIAPGGFVFHVLNRGVGKTRLFRSQKDYQAFQRCLIQTLDNTPMRILDYCVMPNHWHLLLWPEKDGELAEFMMRLTNMHVRRWLTAHNQVGSGHLYQGRYKSFATQDDDHLTTVARYIERNALRAGLVIRAEDWPWSGVGQNALPGDLQIPLTDWPVRRRSDWLQWLNAPQTAAEEEAIRRCCRESRPYGTASRIERSKKVLGWQEPGKAGRPRKKQ